MLRRVGTFVSHLKPKIIPFPSVNIYSKITPSTFKIETDYQIFEQEKQENFELDSTKRKRVYKMKKHKLRKRRKALRKK